MDACWLLCLVPCVGRIVRLGGRRVDHAVGGAWHTVVRTDTGESYVMGCILPAGTIVFDVFFSSRHLVFM